MLKLNQATRASKHRVTTSRRVEIQQASEYCKYARGRYKASKIKLKRAIRVPKGTCPKWRGKHDAWKRRENF